MKEEIVLKLEDLDYFDSKLLDGEILIQKEVIERNKNDPIVKLNYNHRVEVWINEILPNRLNRIDKEHKNPIFINRMGNLAVNDFRRLLRRSEKEGLDDKRNFLLNILLLELSKYSDKKDEYYKERGIE